MRRIARASDRRTWPLAARHAVSCSRVCAPGRTKAAGEQGLVRSEGRDYVVKDGDILLFRFNV